MPSLDEVLSAFPDRDLVIDLKGNDSGDGTLLATRLAAVAEDR